MVRFPLIGRCLRRFGASTRGAAAVEFAFVSGFLILTILFVLVVAMIKYTSQALDYATQKAARQVMTGAVQKAGTGQSMFASTYLCPYLPAAIRCSDVIVNLYTVPYGAWPGGYFTYTSGYGQSLIIPPLSSSQAQYSPGMQGSYEFLLVIYPATFLPSAFTALLGTATYQGNPAYPVVATAAFRNEQF